MLSIRWGETTAYYRREGKRPSIELTTYDKGAHARKKYPDEAHRADGMTRIEVRLKNKAAVQRAFGVRKDIFGRTEDPILGKITEPTELGDVFLSKLKLLGIRPGAESVATGLEELIERVGPHRAPTLWTYLQMRAQLPLAQACRNLRITDETGRRRERELRKVGLYPAAIGVAGVLEDLVAQIQESVGALEPSADEAALANSGGAGVSVAS